jgi:hypothetical protein
LSTTIVVVSRDLRVSEAFLLVLAIMLISVLVVGAWRAYYSGSHCSWATSVTPTLESDKECIGTPDTPVPSRVRLGGPMSLHTAIRDCPKRA